MEGGGFTTKITLYLILIMCSILLAVDSMESYRILNTWTNIRSFESKFFESCLKSELIIRSIFAFFSFMAALSAFILTSFLIICTEWFIKQVLRAYLYMNYYVFGLYMLGISIFGVIHWEDVAYVCDKNLFFYKIFSFSHIISLIGCLFISATITVGVGIYDTILLYTNTILRNEEGNKILGKLFWWGVLAGRGSSDLGMSHDPGHHMEENNANEPALIDMNYQR